eukprot:Opistho-2@49390
MRRAREETEDDEDEEEEEEAMIAEVTGSGMAHGHADGTGDAQRADGTGDAQRDDDAASRAKRRRIAAAHASGASSAADTASADAFGCVEAAVASAEQLARDAPRRCAVGIVTEAHFSMGRTRAAHDGARSSHVIDGDGRRRRFMARIDPSANAACEDELRRSIDKGAFDGMDVIGQFNMGFIIARLGRDLFIVDQHATDEKYNFEELERTTQLCPQPLICPQPLELTAAAEGVLLEHLSVFRQNGFEFLVDADAPVTKRVMLAAVPQSKGTSFGPADVDEMIYLLSESPELTFCRPSRVRAMLASRACRKSIMIGTPLSKPQMKRLLQHMGHMNQPWNCPHGRPTIRHLFDTSLLSNGAE